MSIFHQARDTKGEFEYVTIRIKKTYFAKIKALSHPMSPNAWFHNLLTEVLKDDEPAK